MKKKTIKVTQFLDGLHNYIVGNPQFRNKTTGKSETQIQAEIRPLIISYLEKHFSESGYKDAVAKANKSFYWEGQETWGMLSPAAVYVKYKCRLTSVES